MSHRRCGRSVGGIAGLLLALGVHPAIAQENPDRNVVLGVYQAHETTASVSFRVVEEPGVAYLYTSLVSPVVPFEALSAAEVIARAQVFQNAPLGGANVEITGLRPSLFSPREPENEYAVQMVVLPQRIRPSQVPAEHPVIVLRDVLNDPVRDLTTARDTQPPELVGGIVLDASDSILYVSLRVSEHSDVYLLPSLEAGLPDFTVENNSVPRPALPLVDNEYELTGLRENSSYTLYISLRDPSGRSQVGGLVTATVSTQPTDTERPRLTLSNLTVTHNAATIDVLVNEPATLYHLVTTAPSLDAATVKERASEATTFEFRRRHVDDGEAIQLRWPDTLVSNQAHFFYVAAFDKSRAGLSRVETRTFRTNEPPVPPPSIEIINLAASFSTITLTFRSPDGNLVFGEAHDAELSLSQLRALSGGPGRELQPNTEETYEFGGLMPGTQYFVYLATQQTDNPNLGFASTSIMTVADPVPEFAFAGDALLSPRRIEDSFSVNEAVRWWSAITPSEESLTVDEIIAQPARRGALSAMEEETVIYGGLDPGREYALWYVAQDANNPPLLVSHRLRTMSSQTPVLRIAGASGQSASATLSFYADRAGQVFALVTTRTLDSADVSADLREVRNNGVSRSTERGPGEIAYSGLLPAVRYTVYMFLEAGEGASELTSTSVTTIIAPAFNPLSERPDVYLRNGAGAFLAFVSAVTHSVRANNNAVVEPQNVPVIAYHDAGDCGADAARAVPVSVECMPVALSENAELVLPPGEHPLWWRAENFGLSTIVSQTITVVPAVELDASQTLGQNDVTGNAAVATVTARMSGPWVGASTAPITVGYRIVQDTSRADPEPADRQHGHFTFENGAVQAKVVLDNLGPGADATPGETVLRLEEMPGLSAQDGDSLPTAASRVFIGSSSQHVITTVGQRFGLPAHIDTFHILTSTETANAGSALALISGQPFLTELKILARGPGLYRTFCSLTTYRNDADGIPTRIGTQSFCANVKEGDEFIEDNNASESVAIDRLLDNAALEVRYDGIEEAAAPADQGLLEFKVTVVPSPADENNATVERRLLARVVTTLADDGDLDQDGVPNVDEIAALSDVDDDGIPNFADRLREQAGALQTEALSTTSFITVSRGLSLRLGTIALWTADINAAATYTPLITSTRVRRYQNEAGNAHAEDLDLLDSRFGVFDFEVSGMSHGTQASVVLPLLDNLPDLSGVPRLYKYRTDTGWSEFDGSGDDVLQSMRQMQGACPHADDAVWASASNGLVGGASCLRLTITDGGPNDADGFADGTVRDPAAIALDYSLPPPPPAEPGSTDKGYISALVVALGIEELATRGGGCTLASQQAAGPRIDGIHFAVLLLLPVLAWRRRVLRAHAAR